MGRVSQCYTMFVESEYDTCSSSTEAAKMRPICGLATAPRYHEIIFTIQTDDLSRSDHDDLIVVELYTCEVVKVYSKVLN